MTGRSRSTVGGIAELLQLRPHSGSTPPTPRPFARNPGTRTSRIGGRSVADSRSIHSAVYKAEARPCAPVGHTIMAGLVALAIILLAAVQVQSFADRDEVNEMRLNDLQGKLQDLQHILDERAQTREQRFREFHELRARVHSLTESKCGRREFHCEDSEVHCIHDILVCDGANDCHDGSDEKHCENPAYAGATFHGNEFNNKCEHDFNAEHIHVDVIEEKRYNDFPSISLLDVKVSLDDKSSKMYKGVYSYGEKAMVLYPEHGNGFGMICRFDTDESKFCHAEFISLISRNVCAEAILTLKE
ncbi:hypothetical protein LSH36_20g09035 [Paralvinella palmiformis]|uniref:Annelid erythrocruorin linker subunit C-terminal domain-containing protein n=2 Tax=Bilateria TaxID=33213 RepID=A0AAD9KCU3_9ANNE|nr:hypothetical protein LSH36_20g09035 [Paralvinella palmiformis]